ncbi:hypothetical protein BJY16_005065 [Actinoplanes octamycinicus]|uniref:BNR/Asp-box repeat protein n=1 Tax=Actinoplanes octamycinicus TaxID=135948 RepID=A0A7W7H096_9ACTN|nr:hypothetical protein [Actinoplanes octamycinicus]MBB4741606.1 hypothetical protein [Actinoplanes octamycinicus]GIE57158.1 hypothetical protein Aoc01nite_25600 [Actinoplanes octamycinicus]
MPDTRFDDLRAYAEQAVRQPDFAVIRQRAARHRRRSLGAGLAAVLSVLLATGFGYAVATGSPSDPPPPVDPGPPADFPRLAQVVSTGPDDLYAVVERCVDCGRQLYASPDGGATWQRRAVPASPNLVTDLVVLGKGLLAWRDSRILTEDSSPPATPDPATMELLWTSKDGGRTWRPATVDPEPVAAAPAGTKPVDCRLVGREDSCRVYAVDPATGRFAPLAHQPAGFTFQDSWTDAVSVPAGGRMWIPGLDPVTRKPAVAVSGDNGRSWHTHVFAGGLRIEPQPDFVPQIYLPTVAADSGSTGYALLYRDDRRQDPYRTTDGGLTWQPVTGLALPETIEPGTVTADGAHAVRAGGTFQVYDDRQYWAVALPGFPDELQEPLTNRITHDGAGRYVVFSEKKLCLSDDGRTWRQVTVP